MNTLLRSDFISVGAGATYTRIIDDTEKTSTERNISRFYPTFVEVSEIPIYKAASITAHDTCYKCDLNTIF